MKEPHKIDDIFKKKLDDFQAAPPDNIWDNIKAGVNDSGIGSGIANTGSSFMNFTSIIITISILSVVIVGSIYLLSPDKNTGITYQPNNNKSNQKNIILNENNNDENINNNILSDDSEEKDFTKTSDQDEKTSDDNQNTYDATKEAIQNANNLNNSKKNKSDSKENTTKTKEKQKNRNLISMNVKTQKKSEIIIKNKLPVKSNKTSANDNIYTNENKKSDKKNIAEVNFDVASSLNKDESDVSKNSIAANENKNSIGVNDNQNIKKDTESINNKKDNSGPDSDNNSDNIAENPTENSKENPSENKKDSKAKDPTNNKGQRNVKTPKFDKNDKDKNYGNESDMYIGLNYMQEFWNDMLSESDNYSFGISIQKNFKNLVIQSGIGIGISEDKWVYNTSYKENSIVDYFEDVVSVNFDSLGNIIEWNTVEVAVWDSLNGIHIDNSNKKYTSFIIPLFIGYEFTHKNLIITPKAGILLSLQMNNSDKKNYYINDNATILQITDNSQSRNKSFLQYAVSIEGKYMLNNTIGFTLEPTLLYYPKTVYDNGSLSKKQYYSFGIKGGIVFKLNKL